jgi:hypothetical protein
MKNEITNELEKFRNLVNASRLQQDKVYESLKKLRSLYKQNLEGFGDEQIREVQNLAATLRSKQELEHGQHVRHIHKGFVGIIMDMGKLTKSRRAAKGSGTKFVRYNGESLPFDKNVLEPTGEVSHISFCWQCKLVVDPQTSAECPECGWYKCGKCGRCECDYKKLEKRREELKERLKDSPF